MIGSRSPTTDTIGARSVAFPAIATGVYGYPPAEAATIAIATIRATPTGVEHVRMVAFDEATYEVLAAAARG